MMTTQAERAAVKMEEHARAMPGVHTVRRPVVDDGDGRLGADEDVFDLTYVRNRPGDGGRRGAAPGGPSTSLVDPGTSVPIVVIPGGPGLASVLMYARFRKTAVKRGLDVVMMDHRGTGLSRVRPNGTLLPREAMRSRFVVDDLAAVLDAEGIERAVVVGSSYGTYVAQAFAAVHPDRVAGLVLDSPMLEVSPTVAHPEAHPAAHPAGQPAAPSDKETVARYAVEVLDAPKFRSLVEEGAIAGDAAGEPIPVDELGEHARILHEFAGPEVLDAYYNQLRLGKARRAREFLSSLGGKDFESDRPTVFAVDLVNEIAFRELGYGVVPDSPFVTATRFREAAAGYSPFAGPDVDIAAALPEYPGPIAVVSGRRDLRTPRPVAEVIVTRAQHGVLVDVPDHGHSALDTHQNVLLAVAEAVVAGRTDELAWNPGRWAGIPRSGTGNHLMGKVFRAALAWDRLTS